MAKSLVQEFTKGLWKEVPPFRLVLGLCPTLAVTKSVENGVGMGIAFTAVLVGSNILVSLLRNVIPSKVRIACYIIIIATFVTLIDLLMQAYAFPLSQKLYRAGPCRSIRFQERYSGLHRGCIRDGYRLHLRPGGSCSGA